MYPLRKVIAVSLCRLHPRKLSQGSLDRLIAGRLCALLSRFRRLGKGPATRLLSLQPDFSVKDLQGHALSSADLRAKVVLLDFWATWCQPCKKEMPGYQKLLGGFYSFDVTFVNVALQLVGASLGSGIKLRQRVSKAHFIT